MPPNFTSWTSQPSICFRTSGNQSQVGTAFTVSVCYFGKACAWPYHDLSLTWQALRGWRFAYCLAGSGKPWKSQSRSDLQAHQTVAWKTSGLVLPSDQLPGVKDLSGLLMPTGRGPGDLTDAPRTPWTLLPCSQSGHSFLGEEWSVWLRGDEAWERQVPTVSSSSLGWKQPGTWPGMGRSIENFLVCLALSPKLVVQPLLFLSLANLESVN